MENTDYNVVTRCVRERQQLQESDMAVLLNALDWLLAPKGSQPNLPPTGQLTASLARSRQLLLAAPAMLRCVEVAPDLLSIPEARLFFKEYARQFRSITKNITEGVLLGSLDATSPNEPCQHCFNPLCRFPPFWAHGNNPKREVPDIDFTDM